MNTWFIRSNGQTLHNNPATKLFVPGEPPAFPNRTFNYRLQCLEHGFARVGWPATGDLRKMGWRARGAAAYGAEFKPRYVAYLEGFLTIRTGDLVLMPAEQSEFDVHVGLVTQRDGQGASETSWLPYFYAFDVSERDLFENAHRVPVTWARASVGGPALINLSELGGLWRQGFGRVETASEVAADAARTLGLPL